MTEDKKLYWTYDPETMQCNGVDEYDVQPPHSTDKQPTTKNTPFWNEDAQEWYDPESPEEKLKERLDNLTAELLQQTMIIEELKELNDSLINSQLDEETEEETQDEEEKGEQE